MVIVFGILLVAAGAVLLWAVDGTVSGVEASTIGLIALVVGGIGILASLLLSARATSGPEIAAVPTAPATEARQTRARRDEEHPET